MESLFTSNELQKEYKNSIDRYVANPSDEEAKAFIIKTLNKDLAIQYKNLKEDPFGYEDYLGNLDWLLYISINLTSNSATKSSFNYIKKAVSERQLIDDL